MQQGFCVDCYADGQFKVAVQVDKLGKSKVVFGIGEKYVSRKVLVGKDDHLRLKIGMSEVIDILEKYRDTSELVESFGFIQKYIIYYLKEDSQTDFINYSSYLPKFSRILNLLFEITIIILKQKDLVFVDHDQLELNQCVIWPELFNFLHFLFRETHEAQEFFERYEKLITDDLLKNPVEKFYIGLNMKKSIEHLFDKKHSMKFINQLTDLLRLSSLNALEHLNCDLELIVKEDPYRKMLVLLKNYYCKDNKNSFESYCSVTTREFFFRLIEIINEYTKDSEANAKMGQLIEKELLGFSLKAFKKTEKLTRKITLARDIGISYKNIKKRAEILETLIKENYFSSISGHKELISFSQSFIADLLINKKESFSNFIEKFQSIQTDCVQEIINIQINLSNLNINTVNDQILFILSKYTQVMQPTLLKLYLIKLLSSKDLNQFLKDLNSIQDLSNISISTHLLTPILNHHELIKLFLTSPYSGLDSFGFFISCKVLESISVEYLLKIDTEIKYFDLIFNKTLDASKQQQVFLHILLKKHSSPLKHRFEKFISFIENDESWIDVLCKWINEGLADEAMEKCLNQFFLKDYIAEDLDLYVSAFDRVVDGFFLKKKKEIKLNVINKLIKVLFEYDEVSSGISEKLGKTIISIISIIKEKNILTPKEITSIFKENLDNIGKVERIINFLEKALNDEYIDNENFKQKLFEKINNDNFGIVSEYFSNSISNFRNIYNPLSSNELQDYLVLRFTPEDVKNIPNCLESILSKNITLAKLAQVILSYPPEYQIIENFKPHLCSLIISSPCSELIERYKIQKSMSKYIKNTKNIDLNHLVSRVIEPFNADIYDPVALLTQSVKSFINFSDVLTEFSNSQENLLSSPNLKQISNFLNESYQEAHASNLNNFLANLYLLVKKDSDSFEQPNLRLSNFLKLILGLVKRSSRLQILIEVMNDLRGWFMSEDKYYPQSIKVRSKAYKLAFELKDFKFIENIKRQGVEYFQLKQGIRSSKLQKYSQSLRNGAKGLLNSGNACYMNVILILLSNHEEFVRNLNYSYTQDKPLSHALLYIFGKLQNSYLDCTNAVKILKKSNLMEINNNIQRDSCEFLTELLTYLCIENGEDINSPLEINFLSQFKCDNCGTVKSKIAKELMVYVECTHSEPIGNKLLNYEDNQRFESDNKYHCDICNSKQNASMTLRIKTLPDTFIVQIKRFSYEVQSIKRTKLNTEMKLENQIQVRTEDQGQIQYYLKSILVHSGNTEAGHYFYYKRLNENDWVCINDQKTQIIKNFNPELIETFYSGYSSQNTNPYVLLYSKNLYNSELVLHNDIQEKIKSKNLKYLKLTRFLRSDLFDIIGQMTKAQMETETSMYYFFKYLSEIWQTNEEFIKKSKKLLEIFKEIEDFQKYLDFIETILPGILDWCNSTDPYSYLKIEVIKNLMIKGSHDQRLRFYNILTNVLTTNQNPVNITLVFSLFIEIGYYVFNSITQQMFEYIINFYKDFSIKMQIGLSSIFNFIVNKVHDVDLYYDILSHRLEFLIENLPISNFEPLSILISKFSFDHRNDLINRIANFENKKKFNILILIFSHIAAKNDGSLKDYYNFIHWIFQNIDSFELPKLVKLAYNCLNEQEYKSLVEEFLKPVLGATELHFAVIVKELNEINSDISNKKKIYIELQGEKIYRDPYTRQRFDVVDRFEEYVLIKNQSNGKTELRLLFND